MEKSGIPPRGTGVAAGSDCTGDCSLMRGASPSFAYLSDDEVEDYLNTL